MGAPCLWSVTAAGWRALVAAGMTIQVTRTAHEPHCMDCRKGGACREQVLAGVRILFSRVIPLEQPPASHALWRLAEAFGAACTTAADPGVTHVVASTRGTEKVFWALQSGKQVVLPAWYAPLHEHALSALQFGKQVVLLA